MGAAGRAAASTNVPAGGRILISMGSPAGLRGPAEKHAWAFAVAHPSALHERGGATDGATLQCLGCHDGTVGASGDLSTERAPGIGERRSSHPIGTPYPPRPRRNSDNGYVPLGSLDPRIHLPGGKVGCLSCHDMYGSEQKLLVMSNFESKLCYACHDL
jgi:predicted CXXCH cytochrome family protein